MAAVLLRAAPWPALLALSAVGAAIGGVAVLMGRAGSGPLLLHVALVLVGGAAACALDEPAAAVVDACPVGRSRRLVARSLAASVPLGTGAALVLMWWARTSVEQVQVLQLLGCWVLGFVLATVARRRLDEPAEVVAPGLVLALLSTLLVDPLGRRTALFTGGERTAWTWAAVLAVAGVAVAAAVQERRWARKDG
jgi:hypothetical protein